MLDREYKRLSSSVDEGRHPRFDQRTRGYAWLAGHLNVTLGQAEYEKELDSVKATPELVSSRFLLS